MQACEYPGICYALSRTAGIMVSSLLIGFHPSVFGRVHNNAICWGAYRISMFEDQSRVMVLLEATDTLVDEIPKRGALDVSPELFEHITDIISAGKRPSATAEEINLANTISEKLTTIITDIVGFDDSIALDATLLQKKYARLLTSQYVFCAVIAVKYDGHCLPHGHQFAFAFFRLLADAFVICAAGARISVCSLFMHYGDANEQRVLIGSLEGVNDIVTNAERREDVRLRVRVVIPIVKILERAIEGDIIPTTAKSTATKLAQRLPATVTESTIDASTVQQAPSTLRYLCVALLLVSPAIAIALSECHAMNESLTNINITQPPSSISSM